MGNRANSCTAKSTREKTDKSSGKREARTTDDDIAAFIDRTDVNLLAVRTGFDVTSEFDRAPFL